MCNQDIIPNASFVTVIYKPTNKKVSTKKSNYYKMENKRMEITEGDFRRELIKVSARTNNPGHKIADQPQQ